QHDHRRKERRPVASSYARPGEERKSGGRDQRTDDERLLRAESIHQTSGPARQQEHEKNDGQYGGAGRRGRILLDLNQVERKQEKEACEGRVQEERQHVRAGEVARAEEPRGQHRRGAASLDESERQERKNAERERSEHAHVSPT